MNKQVLDDLISRASKTGDSEDYEKLFDGLIGYELFFNVNAEIHASSARATPTSTPLVDAGPGLKAILFFTSRDNANLNKPYAGILWERALEMLLKMPQANGLIIQSSDMAWVGIDKQKAGTLLSSINS